MAPNHRMTRLRKLSPCCRSTLVAHHLISPLRPILDPQARDASKMANVGRDQDRATRESVRGYGQVEVLQSRTDPLKRCLRGAEPVADFVVDVP